MRRCVTAHPRGVVVTVAAGLCTQHGRLAGLDASDAAWVDVDLPPVVEIRRALLPPDADTLMIAASGPGTAWRDQVEALQRPAHLFIIEGLTMYLAEDEVRALVVDLADRFPGAQLLIETVGAMAKRGGRRGQLRSVRRLGARFTWGVRDMREVAAWHDRLRLVDTWFVMTQHRDRWPRPVRWLSRVPAIRSQSKIGHLTVEPDWDDR